jgi:hypothetical protein
MIFGVGSTRSSVCSATNIKKESGFATLNPLSIPDLRVKKTKFDFILGRQNHFSVLSELFPLLWRTLKDFLR